MRIKYCMWLGLIFLSVCLMSGCVTKTQYQIATQEVSRGYLANKDMVIEAVDGSFRLVGGQEFTSPFQNDMYGCLGCEQYYLDKVDFLNPDNLLAVGGRRVIVKRGNDQLYGILVLNKVFTNQSYSSKYTISSFWKYSSPSLRSYELKIPDSRIESALNGRTTLTYELFATLEAASSVTGQPRNAMSWLLLLSRTQL